MATLDAAQALPAVQKRQVKSPMLLALYGIIPLCLVVMLLDVAFFEQSIKSTFLPVQPDDWAFWAIVFNFPHIVSSIMTMVDKEYWHFYKVRMMKALWIITLGVVIFTYAIPALFPGFIATATYGLFFVFFASYTMYHVLSQQFGIGMMMMRVTQGKLYQWWRILATIAATSLYLGVFASSAINKVSFHGVMLNDLMNGLIGLFVVLASLCGGLLIKQSKRTIGTWYVLSNLAMLYATWLFFAMDYTLFVIMIPRFVHDITAFIIYSVHDQNRNAVEKPNLIYRVAQFIPLPPLLLCPLIAIGIANGIESGTAVVDNLLQVSGAPNLLQISAQVIFIASFFHYYIESFVWKRESIHRHSVSFS